MTVSSGQGRTRGAGGRGRWAGGCAGRGSPERDGHHPRRGPVGPRVGGVEVDELKVPGAWSFTPRQFPDPRGRVPRVVQGRGARAGGRPPARRQAGQPQRLSSRGTLRGVHFADVPPGQAKYVYCTRGAVLDVVVDLRVGSPTFGVSDAVRLDDVDRRGVYLSEGLGHAFLALTDDANVTYLCSAPYSPGPRARRPPARPGAGPALARRTSSRCCPTRTPGARRSPRRRSAGCCRRTTLHRHAASLRLGPAPTGRPAASSAAARPRARPPRPPVQPSPGTAGLSLSTSHRAVDGRDRALHDQQLRPRPGTRATTTSPGRTGAPCRTSRQSPGRSVGSIDGPATSTAAHRGPPD